jgi:hypothetical protein
MNERRREEEMEPPEEARVRELLGVLKEDVRAPASFRVEVMEAVERATASRWKRLADWWIEPRAVRIRPAVGALALAASLALLVLTRDEPPVAPTAAVDPAPAQVVTRFVLIAPEAASVHLTGDFVSWSREGIALEDPRGTGIWTTDVTLPPGVYQYTFVVNGTEWVPDPRAVSQVDDGFGQVNSVVIVPGGEA